MVFGQKDFSITNPASLVIDIANAQDSSETSIVPEPTKRPTIVLPPGFIVASSRSKRKQVSLRAVIVSIHRDRTPIDEFDHHNIENRFYEFSEDHALTLSAFVECRKDPDSITEAISNVLEMIDIDLIVCVGGTGISPTDNTVQVVRPMFVKEMETFGAYMTSISNCGPTCILSNPIAGLIPNATGRLIPCFCISGHHNSFETFLKGVFPNGHGFVAFSQNPRRVDTRTCEGSCDDGSECC